ncbi:MAG: xanthine dehydrogenase family protein subunit M [Comamonas sp.]|jgi:carbon-monoxide dehydrogenase medium subunit|uniref:FAD binding domain-containing protein n=1 Tax=Comamonas sp. TaxID=34028 RepID=UPI00282CD5AE|nr:xanthine dehydrogenase family protein subunit M [Comamonas sp.]MDR0212444.1 xanthine dehydrogenase family protein subunit M [Comamonas sp.]
MRDFDFAEPRSVEEASQLLAAHGDDARIIAGGSALMLAMRQRMLAPACLISVAKLPRLHGIDFDPRQGLRIGAMSRHIDVARSELVRTHAPVLASMAGQVANPQVRNQGTIGGNLCYADPSTDPPGCLMALDAAVVLGSTRGERELSMEEFLVDYYTTAMEPDEVLLEIRVPVQAPGTQGRYTRFLRTAAEHRPLVSVALVVQMEGQICRQARLAVGASTPIPTRLRRAEDWLLGKAVNAELAAQVACIVAEDIQPVSDLRGSSEFRREMVRTVTRRTVAQLFGIDINEGVAA